MGPSRPKPPLVRSGPESSIVVSQNFDFAFFIFPKLTLCFSHLQNCPSSPAAWSATGPTEQNFDFCLFRSSFFPFLLLFFPLHFSITIVRYFIFFFSFSSSSFIFFIFFFIADHFFFSHSNKSIQSQLCSNKQCPCRDTVPPSNFAFSFSCRPMSQDTTTRPRPKPKTKRKLRCAI